MPTLLVVDDEPSVLAVFRRVFENDDLDTLTAQTGEQAIKLAAEGTPDCIVLDVLLPDQSGLEVFERVRRIDPKVPVLFITAGGTSETAIEAMRLGALDYLLKPLDFGQVRKLVNRALEIRRLANEPVRMRQVMTSGNLPLRGDLLVGRSPGMQEVYKAIGRVASQNVTVLVRGESGTGKELVARALYQHSDRKEQPFMAVNCAAIAETLLESELFGHEKGAFTGADHQRVGKFEQCSGGTLFLDEIGDMSAPLQSKMLRVLQEQRFERVGGNQTIQTDVRIITATNRDLEEMVTESAFRSDLYYRLNGYTIELPPLRERGEDLLLLVDHFLALVNRKMNKDVQGVAPDALDSLQRYSWPGNVRELQSVIRHAVLESTGPVLLADFLPDSVRTEEHDEPKHESSADAPIPAPMPDDLGAFIEDRLQTGSTELYDETIRRVERRLITSVLTHTGGNQLEAAKILGVSRTTLRTKIRQLGVTIDRTVSAE